MKEINRTWQNIERSKSEMQRRRPVLLSLLFLSASATILQAQSLDNADYLYRATDGAKPEHVLGTLTFDSAKKSMAFTAVVTVLSDKTERDSIFGKPHKSKVKEPKLLLEIPTDTVTSATYERTASVNWLRSVKVDLYLTIQYKTSASEPKFALFRFSGDEQKCLEVLAWAEAALGKALQRH